MTSRTLTMDSADPEEARRGQGHSGMLDTARDDTASIAMDPGTDVSRVEQGQAGLHGSVSNNTVCIAIEPEKMDETRPDQNQSGACSTTCDNTMNIVMETTNHAMEVETAASPAALLDGIEAPLPTPSTPLSRERSKSPRLRGEAPSASVLYTSHIDTDFVTECCCAGDVEVGRRAVDGPRG